MPSWRDSAFKRSAQSASKVSAELDDRFALELASGRVDRLLAEAPARLNISRDSFEGDFGLTAGFSARG